MGKHAPKSGAEEEEDILSVCRPIWHLNKSVPTVRCGPCMASKKGCSFKSMDWGISEWPELTKTEAALERRKKEAEAKRRSNEEGKKVVAGSSKVTGTDRERGPGPAGSSTGLKSVAKVSAKSLPKPGATVIKDVFITSLPPKASAPLPTHGSFGATTVSGGSVRSMFFEDLMPYEAIRRDPDRTPLMVKMKVADLRSARFRERGEARALLKLVESRSAIAAGLMDALLEDVKFLETKGAERDGEDGDGDADGEGDVDEGRDEGAVASGSGLAGRGRTDPLEEVIRQDEGLNLEEARRGTWRGPSFREAGEAALRREPGADLELAIRQDAADRIWAMDPHNIFDEKKDG